MQYLLCLLAPIVLGGGGGGGGGLLFFFQNFLKGRFLLFQVYRNFANLFFKLSVSSFYKEISKFQQKVQS